MKLATYLHKGQIFCGIITEKGVIDIPSAAKGKDAPRSIKEILARGDSAMAAIAGLADSAEDFIQIDEVKLLAPIPRPGKVIALAGNYEKHIIEGGLKLGLSESPRSTTVPRPFLMPATVITGPDTEIGWPTFSEQVDYEVELAVVIGKAARCVPPAEALDYVAGYCIANDISARSVTFKENRQERPWDEFFDWLNGKWSDGFLPLGPYLTTADEIEDVQTLDLELTVNGQIRQNANTSQMIFAVADIVSFLSYLMTLEPGDVIATGTPEGVAMATGEFLQPGDKIECKIKNLGTLTNTVGNGPAQFYKPLKK
jgi:2-keto-4-pentenoate hydratase/2-oxohepta-3-ene-1,7-dioic acid hydratase in catechol pathway